MDALPVTVQAAVDDLHSIALPFVLESLFYGMFILVYLFAAISLAERRGKSRLFMLAVTTIMFVSSTAHWSLDLWSFLQALSVKDYHLWPDYVARLTRFHNNVTHFQLLLSDVIVLWRACVLWKSNYIVYGVSAMLLLVTLAFEAVDLALARVNIAHANVTFFVPVALYNNYGTVCVLSSLLSNLWATSLVGFKAWKHRLAIGRSLQHTSSTSVAQKVMSLLVECGALYCLIWILFLVAFVTDPGALVVGGRQDIPNTSSDHIISQITGIYPTIIVVLVRYQKSYNEHTFSPPEVRSTRADQQETIELDLANFSRGESASARDSKQLARRDLVDKSAV